ncbi:MAG TPA: AgmX/PglI C-terminal domain-containing protein [Polyangia bacterium]|nr:AgmX/PglI C-terminal domain-containing protein [Polyangia bacterium]
MTGRALLQVAVIWRGQILGYRLLSRRGRVTVGPSKRATFTTPPVQGRNKYLLVRPRKGNYVVHLAPELRGDLTLGGVPTSVAEIANRDVTLAPGDKAKLLFDGTDLRLEIRWVDPPEILARPKMRDPQMVQITVGTAAVLGLFAILLNLVWDRDVPRPPLALDSSRITKIQAPQALDFEKVQKQKQEAAEKAAEKSKEKEGQTKRAKEKAGRVGREDATQKDTVIPKGKDDILREKVQKVGILSVLGKQKAPGSGLSKLFAQSNEVEQAMAGMAGAKMAVGHGSGGLSTAGSGAGGGGTGYGHIYGAGSLDTGGHGARGRGRGPKLAERGEHEVGVSLGKGGGETDGSLSKEQIEKVVRAHMAGVKYCYEKELQHKSSLAGGIDLYWVIQPDGAVSKANVKQSSLSDAAVEGCIVRQVKQWQFPKAPGQTIVGRYPFIFKGGM